MSLNIGLFLCFFSLLVSLHTVFESSFPYYYFSRAQFIYTAFSVLCSAALVLDISLTVLSLIC